MDNIISSESSATTCISHALSKLLAVQVKLKANKTHYNEFGNFYYRNAEDILNSAKPILEENKCTIILSDTVETHNGLNYVKATAYFYDCETGEHITCSASAQESIHPKMCPDQCTGAASSYARKYCLNGLLLIDDGVDSDQLNDKPKDENANRQSAKPAGYSKPPENKPQSAKPPAKTNGWGNSQSSAAHNNNNQQPNQSNAAFRKPAAQVNANTARTSQQNSNPAPKTWGQKAETAKPTSAPPPAFSPAIDFSAADADDYPF